MEDKFTDLTDLQLAMVKILHGKGVKLEECRPAEVTIKSNSIGVKMLEGENGCNSTEEWLVSVLPEQQTILIVNNSCLVNEISPLGLDKSGIHCCESIDRITEIYQIDNGNMHLIRTVQHGDSEKSFLGGRVDKLVTDTQTFLFALPEGYTITDGIDPFDFQSLGNAKQNFLQK